MIVVKIEMWPLGDESNAEEIGRATITNDGTGSLVLGNYNVELLKRPMFAKTPGVWKRGRVEDFERLTRGPYDLLYAALRGVTGMESRNP